MNEIEKLKEINELQELILSVLFHDLRGLLSTIDNISSVLSNGYDTFSENDKKLLLKTLSGSTNQLNNSVDSLLSWIYFRMDKLNMDFEIVNLVILIDSILNQMSNYIILKEIKVNFNFQKEFEVNANESMLYVGILNIIHNAIKYSELGSEIKIDIIKKRRKIILTVSDNGIGISKTNLNKLYQLPCGFRTSGTNGESGFGLGLVIAKDFIEASDGTIEIESALKKGTVVNITLPEF